MDIDDQGTNNGGSLDSYSTVCSSLTGRNYSFKRGGSTRSTPNAAPQSPDDQSTSNGGSLDSYSSVCSAQNGQNYNFKIGGSTRSTPNVTLKKPDCSSFSSSLSDHNEIPIKRSAFCGRSSTPKSHLNKPLGSSERLLLMASDSTKTFSNTAPGGAQSMARENKWNFSRNIPVSDFSASSKGHPKHASSTGTFSNDKSKNNESLLSDFSDNDKSFTDSDIVRKPYKRRNAVETPEENSDKSTDINDIYLSLMWNSGKLGVSYYDVEEAQIHMMPDVTENDDFTMMKAVCRQVKPGYIILSARQDERLQQAVFDLGSDKCMNNLSANFMQILPSVEFSLDLCKRRVIQLNLPCFQEHSTDSERSLYMSSLIPFENTNMVRAVGGLLKFLEKNRIGVQLEEADVRIPVLAVQIFHLDDLMLVDENSCNALNIFQSEFHPSAFKAGTSSNAKEGLSLFGILNRCKSVGGSKMMRTWFQRPLTNLEKLVHRQEAAAFFAASKNTEITTSLQNCLKHIKNISVILKRMSQAQASYGDWQSLYKTIYNAIYIGDICRAQPMTIAIFSKVRKYFNDGLPKMANVISKVVDFEESAVQSRFVVKPHVDDKLDAKKRTYNGLPDLMTKVAREELAKLSEDIPECNVIYLPQLGYLLAIPATRKALESEDYNLPDLEFMYASNQVLHYKSSSTKELDRLLGDTQCDIHDMETSIMHKLQNYILEQSQLLVSVTKISAELDCLVALGVSAKEFNYTRPKLTKENVIEIDGGRHPLQELCCSPFVPNKTQMGSEYHKMVIITGPNASGKSVYLKQVALIVFMAQIGSFVPADSAVIGLVDQIFTRIRTMESISVSLSTFMIDLNQVSLAIRHGTARSLVVIDEFGKGTENVDGVSLVCSCLRHWLRKEGHCPYVLLSTHFHNMIHQQLLPESNLLKYMTMEVLHEQNELVFLYQLIEGSTQSSYACHVASSAGLPDRMLARAAEVSDLIRTNNPVSRIDAVTTQLQFERCKTIATRFLKLNLDNAADVKEYMQKYIVPLSKEKG